MLQEMQRGRVAESAQAGRGNLQTQILIGDGTDTQAKIIKILKERGVISGDSQVSQFHPYLCSERGTRGGEGSRPWCTQPLSPQWGWAAQASFSFPPSARGGAVHANVCPSRGWPAPPSSLVLELSSHPD